MQHTKTKISSGNPSFENRKNRPKNIYQLDNIPRQADECELNYHSVDYDYDDLLKYAFLLRKYCSSLNENFNENDSLISVVNSMEESIRSDGDYIKVDNFVYMGRNEIEISESCYLFTGSIFSYNMSFLNWDIPENIKIGLSKVFVELYKFYGDTYEKSRFKEGMLPLLKHAKEMYSDELHCNEGEQLSKDFDKEFEKYIKYCEKLIVKAEKYSKKKFKKTVYFTPQIQEIQEAIEYILEHDITQISVLRTDSVHNTYGDSLPVDCMLRFTYHDYSETTDNFTSWIIESIVNEANETGGEMLYGIHKVTLENTQQIHSELIESMRIYETKLTHICSFLTEKYNYDA